MNVFLSVESVYSGAKSIQFCTKLKHKGGMNQAQLTSATLILAVPY